MFNIAESFAGKSALESNIAALLNLLDLRYTGSSPAGLIVAGDKTIPVRVSVGVAAAGPAELGVTALIERADAAMYQAKRAGKDRCGADEAAEASLVRSEIQAIGPPRTGRRS